MYRQTQTRPSGNFFQAAVQLARPGHWIKNVIVLFPVIFAMRIGDGQAWLKAGLAAVAFCLASSAAYVINDIYDRDKDSRHPRKSGRPLASGRMSLAAAAGEGIILAAAAAGVAFSVNWLTAVTVLAYVALQLAYTFYLKSKMLVDVICIALGFVLRAVAGAVAIAVEISPWLFVCTFTLCLFMGFCKRCNEIVTMPGGAEAREHRPTLSGYTSELLTHLITLSAGVAVVSFLLYGMSPRTVGNFGTNYLIYTIPIVVYGVFRFAMLSMKGAYADPADLVLRDRPFQLTAVIWVAAALVVIRWGRSLQAWLESL
ncbi:MAG: decaprenyl-phosphate phosphoribosyltransferase [Planctomycetota bacterium]|jgi:4-hydroxybenzoate polyprenyltransferase